jgi:antitoxin ParD1/3/4
MMPTMNVSLTPEISSFVSREIASGDYATASELVRDALRLLRRERDMEEQKLEILRRKVDIGIGQAERGEFSDRSVMDILDAALDEADE